MGADITARRDGPAAVLAFSGEDGRNLLDLGLLLQLRQRLEDLNDDRDYRCVVLTGEGAAFSEGWAPEAAEDAELLWSTLGGLLWMSELRKPVIAAVRGACLGGGLELALACDIRVCAPGAVFGTKGEFPLAGGAQRLARVAGRAQALRLLLTGAEAGSDEALRCGIVSEVVDDPVARALEVAGVIASRGPIGVHFGKEAVHRGVEMPLEQALRYETDLTIILQATADRAEGVRAFLEKRDPHFEGR